jgi:hypothetical protein
MLAERSQHRAVPLPDLPVAACAERSGLTVLHHDADFERTAEQVLGWAPDGARRARDEAGAGEVGGGGSATGAAPRAGRR